MFEDVVISAQETATKATTEARNWQIAQALNKKQPNLEAMPA